MSQQQVDQCVAGAEVPSGVAGRGDQRIRLLTDDRDQPRRHDLLFSDCDEDKAIGQHRAQCQEIVDIDRTDESRSLLLTHLPVHPGEGGECGLVGTRLAADTPTQRLLDVGAVMGGHREIQRFVRTGEVVDQRITGRESNASASQNALDLER